MNGIIYKATNRNNGKIYVGQTIKSLEHRKQAHKSKAKTEKTTYFWRALTKYGFDAFDWDIVCDIEAPTDILLIEYLNITEQIWIAELNTINHNKGYNLTEGGLNGKLSDETKKKLSEINKGNCHSDETKKKISESLSGEKNHNFGLTGKKNHLWGKHHSEESKKKMSQLAKGRKHSDETKKKLSKAHKGQIPWNKGKTNVYSTETRRRMSKSHNGNHHSDETKKKISETMKTKDQS